MVKNGCLSKSGLHFNVKIIVLKAFLSLSNIILTVLAAYIPLVSFWFVPTTCTFIHHDKSHNLVFFFFTKIPSFFLLWFKWLITIYCSFVFPSAFSHFPLRFTLPFSISAYGFVTMNCRTLRICPRLRNR